MCYYGKTQSVYQVIKSTTKIQLLHMGLASCGQPLSLNFGF